jgi:hypothetical protein
MFRRSILLVPVLLVCAYGQGTTGSRTLTQNYLFPPIGLASSETAQVNVLNIAPASAAANATAGNATAPSCTGTITFANAAGTAIGSAVSFATAGTQIFSKQLAFSELGVTGMRGEFVASVQATTAFPSKAPCSLVFSLETFDDATGATHIFLGNAASAQRLPVQPLNLPQD